MNLNLEVDETNLVLEALGEMPAKRSFRLIAKILAQVNEQQKPLVPVSVPQAPSPE